MYCIQCGKPCSGRTCSRRCSAMRGIARAFANEARRFPLDPLDQLDRLSAETDTQLYIADLQRSLSCTTT